MGGYSQPGADAGPNSQSAPGMSTGQGAANPATANPALKNALGAIASMAQMARQYAQAYPQCAEEMRTIGEQLQKCMQKTTAAQQPSEPAAPPV